jgi:hypothetical protein
VELAEPNSNNPGAEIEEADEQLEEVDGQQDRANQRRWPTDLVRPRPRGREERVRTVGSEKEARGREGVGGDGEDDGINNCSAGKTSGKRSDG